MNKKVLLTILVLAVVFCMKNVYAFDAENYKNRSLCGNFEVAGFHSDGTIVSVRCFDNYDSAKKYMIEDGYNDLAIMTKVAGYTKIIDANVALLDLSVNPETLTYFYTNSELTGSAYTYMDTGSLYGGVDGAHLETSYSNTYNVWTAKVRIGNFTGWIRQSAYEIVPITWVKSSSSYTVTSTDIRHNYVSKIQKEYYGSAGRTIGPKPSVVAPGTYYSYDGHYFYQNLETLIRDYKNSTYINAVNPKNPYYNYYMYVSNHTKTAYSSVNIDEYIRNNLGYTQNVYGNSASSGTSRLYGMGTFFYYAQEKYGVNAILSLSLSRNETGNGTSNLAINKNNGFGLNAVDSNPIQAANWYPSFASSILGYASKWITYGYAHPRDWRYFGPQFGDKWIGMNVKYASDTYWSEKMAANYYALDKALGLQDYNYYQLGVVVGPTNAYSEPSTSSQWIYSYPEKEDAVVIVGETTRNNTKWYEVVSDLNIDSNNREITSGDYNWNKTVYVEASQVLKINEGKNGYISPNSVYQYKNTNYEYDLYIENSDLKPKVAITTKSVPYYYDSSLTSKTGVTLLKDRYIMVYTAAYENGLPVAYLVTSDYWKDQKHWISADSIKFTNTSYGKVSVTVSGNQYTWVNYNTEDARYSLISGLYTNSYVPVLETIQNSGNTWYKVPVSLTSNDNIYGYTLASAPGVSITLSASVVENQKPVIEAKDQTIYVGDEWNPKDNVKATDVEDGDLTNSIEITTNNVNTKVAGTYSVTYQVKDSQLSITTKTISVIVKEDQYPTITAKNKTIEEGEEINLLEGVVAKDLEDGDLTKDIKIKENSLDRNKEGTYQVTYEVTDSKNNTTTKTISVIVVAKKSPSEKEEQTLDEKLENSEDGEFQLEDLSWDKTKKVFTVSGYLIILNQNNTSKEYSLIFENKDTEKTYSISIDKWIESIPYDLGEENGKSYRDAWFKGELHMEEIPNGDYNLYIQAEDDDHYTIMPFTNFFNKNISRRGEDSFHGYNFKVQQKSKQKEIECSIRDELYTTMEAPTTRNMVNGYDEISLSGNKLYFYGYSYDYEGTYNNGLSITRKCILENTKTYEQTVFDVGSTTGPFNIQTLDNQDKTYAWFEKELDLSKLEKGTYSILIYTKTSNAANYDIVTDIFRSINETTTINDKTYTITYNKDRENRIEIIVK